MNKIFNLMFALSAAVVITSCSSDSGGAAPAPAAPIGDITGSWAVSETTDGTACGDGITVNDYNLNVTAQTGNSITYTSNGNTFTGTLAGNTLTSSGSYPEQGGTVTGSTTITIDSVCSAFSGNATWSWTDGVEPCSGTATLTGTRNNSTGCGNTSSASATETEPNDAFNVANTLTVGVPVKATTTSTIPEDDDYYVFTVPTDGKYKFSIDYGSANTITIVLLDVNLAVLESNTISIESADTIRAGTTFYIQVDPFTTSGTVPYTLTVNTI